MLESEFRETLPVSFPCKCGSVSDGLHWHVARFDAVHWLAVCVVSCRSCPWVHVAAAGSSDDAHFEAQSVRSSLLKAIGK